MMKFTLRLVLTIFLASASLSACQLMPENTPTETTPPRQWEFGNTVQVTGRVILRETYHLSFQVPGKIQDIFVEAGQPVQAGDILARLDSSSLEDAVAEAEAVVAIKQADLQRLLAGVDPAQIAAAESELISAQAEQPLTRAQSTAQAADITAAQAKLDYLKSLPLPVEVSITQAEVDQAQTLLDIAKRKLEQVVLIAPIDSVVMSREILKDEYAGIGQTVLEVGDPNDLVIEAEITDQDLTYLEIGSRATITFDAYPDIKTQGTITRIRPNEAINASGFIITVTMDAVPPGVRWGMTANLIFNI